MTLTIRRLGIVMIAVALLASVQTRAGAADAPPPANPTRIAFLGIWDRSAPLVDQAMRQSGINAKTLQTDQVLSKSEDVLKDVDVLLVLNMHAPSIPALKTRFEAARKANPNLRIIILDHRGSQAALKSAGLLDDDPKVMAYWLPNGAANLARLLKYVDKTYLGGDSVVEPPMPVPDYGFYIPGDADHPAENVAALKAAGHWKDGAPVIALLIQQSFWITRDLKVVDAEAQALRERGFNVAVVFAQTAAQMESLLVDLHPDVLAEDRHGTLWTEPQGGKTFLQRMDAPYLRPVSMLAYTNAQWLADPEGMHRRDVSGFVTLQESKGTIEPIVVGGLEATISGYQLHAPIPERVNHFADRAWSWAALRRKPNADKRIAIVYYNTNLGKDDLMRGTPTGGFLDGPESLMRFLPALVNAGYTVRDIPQNAADLIERIRKQGRNIGPWAQGELDAEAAHESSVLIGVDEYMKWFNTKLSEANRKAVIDHYGPPPGRLMVTRRDGKAYIVIPTVRLGNIILAPQPLRGQAQDTSLLHSSDIPPPHNYLAFYWWLQEDFHADAVLHWGTHGSLELLPGKTTGLSKDDWTDICAGTMPIINPWIMDNLGEGTISRRRSYALLVDHLVPPALRPGLPADAQHLHDDIEKFNTLTPGVLREEFRRRIADQSRAQRLIHTLNLSLANGALFDDAQIKTVHTYLHTLMEERTPTSLHILGQSPDHAKLADYLVAVLHKPFLERVAALMPHTNDARGATPTTQPNIEARPAVRALAEAIVRESVLGDKTPDPSLQKDIDVAKSVLHGLDQAGDEITHLIDALAGRYISPGPGPDPIRNSTAVPSGRNLYGLNPEEIPTKASFAVAKELVNQMLASHKVHKAGFDLSGSSTMRDYGVTEGQILYLMGIEPIWDRNNLAIDVRLIPMTELKRPRVDVFVALGGSYKANFPSRVKLLDKAIRLASSADEQDNGVRAGTMALESALIKKGFSTDRARDLSTARIFGTKVGSMSGTNILYLVPRSGAWSNEDDITSVYIDNMRYVYTGDLWGAKVDGLYEQAIQGTDTIIRTWSSNLTSPLSNHHAYEYLGGLSMAVTKLTGREPTALIADVRDPAGARIRDFNEVLSTNLRTQLLNPNWIKGMKEHDYAGAGQIAELMRNTFGWSVTRKTAVSNETWNELYATYIQDKNKLDLDAWFAKVNPHARQEVAATMLEAARKGYWNASLEQVATLSRLYVESVVKNGPSEGMMAGGNTSLHDFALAHLSAPGDPALAAAFNSTIAKATAASAPGPNAPAPSAPGQQPPAAASATPAAPGASTDGKAEPQAPSASAAPSKTIVQGQRLDPVKKDASADAPHEAPTLSLSDIPWWSWALGAGVLMIVGAGYFRRTGGIA